jgi:hypothetical protein
MDIWRGAVHHFKLLLTTSSRRHTDNDYELLSSDPASRTGLASLTSNALPGARRRAVRSIFHWHSCLYFFTIRRALLLLASFPFLLALLVLIQGVPPNFEDIRIFERNFPQHNLSHAKHGMFLRFPGHLWGHGLNNILQET